MGAVQSPTQGGVEIREFSNYDQIFGYAEKAMI